MKWNKIIFAIAIQGTILSTTTAQQKIVRLSSNENPNGITLHVRKAIEAEISKANLYAADDGAAFVDFVAGIEQVPSKQIIVGENLEALGIYLSLRKGNNASFIYTVPGYPALVNAGASVGGKVISIPLNSKGENDLAAIEQAVDDNTAAVFLVNPHNPTGTLSDPKIFHDFIHRISQKAVVVVDEAYLEYSGKYATATAINNVKEGDNVIVFKTLAKAYGLGGLDIGYSVTTDALATFLRSKGLGDTHSLNRLSIAAARQALLDSSALNATISLVKKERGKWQQFFTQNKLEHTHSEASYVFFNLNIPHQDIKELYKKEGILVGNNYPAYPSWVRITIGNPDENIKAQQATLNILRKYK